jgi:hypothetical protein
MNHKLGIVGEFEPDDLQKVPGLVGSDCEHLGWIGVGFEVDHREGMVNGVADGSVVETVFASGAMDLHITIS